MPVFLFIIAIVLAMIGASGVILKRNPLVMLMCIELMLNGANLMLVTSDRVANLFTGQLFALTLIAVAAAEVAVGLALVIRIFHEKKVPDVDEYSSMSG